MRKIVLFMILYAGSIVSQAQIASGLVAKYSFNNGNANDDIGSAHGTVTGATLTTDRFGNANKAYNFNGSAYINCGNPLVVQNLKTAFSISAWFKRSSNNTNLENIISKWAFTTVSEHFTIGTRSGQILWASPGPGNQGVQTGTITNNSWQHVVMTWTSAGAVRIYLNNVLVGTTNLTTTNVTISTPVNMFIGAQDASTRRFNGGIDDVRIYNRAINALEVDSLFKEANPVVLTSNIENGVVAKYSFNGGNANDEIGTNHGTVVGATLTLDRFGNSNKAYAFTGTNHIKCNNRAALQGLTTQYSISAWFKRAATSTGLQAIVAKWNFTPASEHLFVGTQNASVMWATPGAGNQGTFTGAWQTNTWQHVVMTWTSAGAVRIYLNNSLISSPTLSNSTVNITAPVKLYIGAQDSVTRNFNGSIDDVRIYNRVLNVTEVADLFNEPDPTITSVASDLSKNLIKMYPNPVRDKLFLGAAYAVSITDLAGKTLLSSETAVEEISVSHLASGCYILSIMDKNGAILQRSKFIKASE